MWHTLKVQPKPASWLPHDKVDKGMQRLLFGILANKANMTYYGNSTKTALQKTETPAQRFSSAKHSQKMYTCWKCIWKEASFVSTAVMFDKPTKASKGPSSFLERFESYQKIFVNRCSLLLIETMVAFGMRIPKIAVDYCKSTTQLTCVARMPLRTPNIYE